MILVVGATGSVGESIVRTLRQYGAQTRALVRSGSEYFWLNDSGTQFFFGDLRDPISLKRAAKGIDAAIISVNVWLESRENNHLDLLKGVNTLCKALLEAGCKKVVLNSCVGADLDIGVPAFHARKEMEQCIINSGIPFTILRSPPHEGYFIKLAASAIRIPQCSGNVLYPISTSDIALASVASLDSENTVNQTMTLCGPKELSARGVYELACQALNEPRKPTYITGTLYGGLKKLGRPFRRFSNRWSEIDIWFTRDFQAQPSDVKSQFGIELTSIDEPLHEFSKRFHIRNTPELREQHMVHPQFYATVYSPGTAKLSDMPKGPVRPSDNTSS